MNLFNLLQEQLLDLVVDALLKHKTCVVVLHSQVYELAPVVNEVRLVLRVELLKDQDYFGFGKVLFGVVTEMLLAVLANQADDRVH